MRCSLTHPFSPSLVFYPPSPSVLLSLAAFIHPCHFVFSFLLYSFASNTAGSSLLHSSSYPSVILSYSLPLMMRFSFFFYSLYFSFLLQLFLPPFPCLTCIIPSIFFQPRSPSIYFSMSLCFSSSFHSVWVMALLILSVMILPKDNHREENLFNLPEYLCVQCFVRVCVCVCVCNQRPL